MILQHVRILDVKEQHPKKLGEFIYSKDEDKF